MVKRSHHAQIRGGFTLMEMMVVVAIIVVLVGLAAPILFARLDDAKRSATQANLKTISAAADMFKLRNDRYPVSLAELTQATVNSGAFLEPKDLLDPWHQPYQYVYPGQHNAYYDKPDIWSLGSRPGDPNQYIGNW